MGKIICLYGLAACGKTTQADKMSATTGMVQFGMGENLRAEIESGSELGQKIKTYVDSGTLITDDLMEQVIKKVGDEAKAKGIIFDGFPRMISQAEMLDRAATEMNMEISSVIYLNVSVDEAVKRLTLRAESGSRADDKDPVAVKNRLGVFAKESVPLLEYYRQKGNLVEINGELSIEEVFAEIQKYL